jgi:Type VI secretion system/phage-baseplate injector OB domain
VIDRFPGKYLGIVVDNDDPNRLSRVRARVPEVFGDETIGWCLPCSPYAGSAVGLAAVPPIDSLVFVEWPGGGDTTRTPIWSGGMWSGGNGIEGAGPDVLVLVTPGGNRVALRDEAGGEAVEIETASGAKLTLDTEGVHVEFGSQKIEISRTAVTINGGALEVR